MGTSFRRPNLAVKEVRLPARERPRQAVYRPARPEGRDPRRWWWASRRVAELQDQVHDDGGGRRGQGAAEAATGFCSCDPLIVGVWDVF